MTFFSSRRFPGHEYASSALGAAGELGHGHSLSLRKGLEELPRQRQDVLDPFPE